MATIILSQGLLTVMSIMPSIENAWILGIHDRDILIKKNVWSLQHYCRDLVSKLFLEGRPDGEQVRQCPADGENVRPFPDDGEHIRHSLVDDEHVK